MSLEKFAFRIYELNHFANFCERYRDSDPLTLVRAITNTRSFRLGMVVCYYQSLANKIYNLVVPAKRGDKMLKVFLTDLNETVSSYYISEFDYGVMASGLSFCTILQYKTLIKVTRLLVNKLREVYVKG